MRHPWRRATAPAAAFVLLTLTPSSPLFAQATAVTITRLGAPRKPPAELPANVFAPEKSGDVVDRNDPVDPEIAQFLPQYRQAAKGEIRLVARVCKLSTSQREALARATEKAARDASRQFLQSQQDIMKRGRQVGMRFPEARAVLEEVMTPVVLSHLNREQAVDYKDQIARRKEARKQAAVANIVAEIDRELILSDDQRVKLRGVISKGWQESWRQSVSLLLYNNAYFPNIPDREISPVLNPTQRQVWQSLNKNQGQNFVGFDLGLVSDDDPDGEAEAEAQGAAVMVIAAPLKVEVEVQEAAVMVIAAPAKAEAKKAANGKVPAKADAMIKGRLEGKVRRTPAKDGGTR